MKLHLAILNVLEASPRPITAAVVTAIVPQFDPKPPLATDVKRAEAAVISALEMLEELGDVMFSPHRDLGRLWTITKTGRARIG